MAKDWDLSLLSSSRYRNSEEHPYGLRRHRFFHNSSLYYVAIVIDFTLRCTWSFKLSPHLDHFNDLEGGIFLMEVLEVFRRWIWIFVRVETEWGESNISVLMFEVKKLTAIKFAIVTDLHSTTSCWGTSMAKLTKTENCY